MGIALLAPILFLAVVEGQAPNPALIPPGAQRYYSTDGGYDNKCRIEDCKPNECPAGQYLLGCGANKRGDCTNCKNTKPLNSIWKTNGGTSETGCTWECDSNHNFVAGGCELKTCAEKGMPTIQNSIFLLGDPGIVPNCKYQCSAGYIGTTPAGARGPVSCSACLTGTFQSTAGLTYCSNCVAGTFSGKEGSTSCEICAALKYSTGTQNTACSNCALCGTGSYRSNCGGSSAGTCTNCNNTNWP
jgi:hypothetical protein